MSGWNPLRESLGPDEGLRGLREFYVSWYVCLTGGFDREFVCLAHRSEIIAKFLGSINPNSNHVTVTKPDSKGEVPTDGPYHRTGSWESDCGRYTAILETGPRWSGSDC